MDINQAETWAKVRKSAAMRFVGKVHLSDNDVAAFTVLLIELERLRAIVACPMRGDVEVRGCNDCMVALVGGC